MIADSQIPDVFFYGTFPEWHLGLGTNWSE